MPDQASGARLSVRRPMCLLEQATAKEERAQEVVNVIAKHIGLREYLSSPLGHGLAPRRRTKTWEDCNFPCPGLDQPFSGLMAIERKSLMNALPPLGA